MQGHPRPCPAVDNGSVIDPFVRDGWKGMDGREFRPFGAYVCVCVCLAKIH
ncbi:hypothetical protein CDEST_06563 [Colletotrichum destructivum]|uniref:Uncharacterized protein n=1 Tax=Colletotrichum destructivum TaxID=34406 RepID=A0AAX4IF65_9PEZI|nr:hypothetical protein CDEST_06563 [Colletotrichum destructivum]